MTNRLALRVYLAAIVIFVNEVKGKSAMALSRDLNVQYKTAFVLAHKIREAMASEMKGAVIGGAGRTVVGLVATNGPSVDFCGYRQRSRRAA